MSLSISGNDLIFDGQVAVTNYSNPAAGVVTLTLTPSGGVGSLPALVNGDPGLPPILNLGTVTTLTVGSSATVDFTKTADGGSGTASAYTVDFGIPVGATGDDGTNGTLAGCSDLSGTAATGDIVTVSAISPDTAFAYSAFPWAFVVNPSSISAVSTTGQATVQMCSVSVAAQTFAWMPVCFASAIVVGTTNTVVQLQATMSAGSRSGDVVGNVTGYGGQATQALSMLPSFGALIGPSQAYGVVAAGDTATIYLKATETASTADAWAISDTTASFTVLGVPVSS